MGSGASNGMEDSARGIIAAQELSAYERWELPVVERDGAGGGGARGPLTAAELETLERTARREGFEAGRAEGIRQGMQEAAQRMRPALSALESAVGGLGQPFAELDKEVEHALVKLSLLVARCVVHREPTVQPEVVCDAVRAALAVLPQASRSVRVALNPDDLELVREAMGAEQPGWFLEADAEIARGGCIVHSESSKVDATLERQLAAVVSHVLGGAADESTAR